MATNAAVSPQNHRIPAPRFTLAWRLWMGRPIRSIVLVGR
jgi:hypothetical protein